MTSARATRAARSGAPVAAAVLVALVAHLAGGGTAPSPLLPIAVAALAWPPALLLTGLRPSLWRQAAAVGATQAMLHGLFAVGLPAAGPGPAEPMAGMHGAPLHLAAAPAMHHDGTMWLAHAVAWAVTVGAWRFGERALRLLLQHLPAPLRLALLVPVVTGPGTVRIRVPRRMPLPAAVLTAAHRDRGPPLPA